MEIFLRGPPHRPAPGVMASIKNINSHLRPQLRYDAAEPSKIMKTRSRIFAGSILLLALVPARAAEPARAAAERVGVYESRIVSSAHFWSEPVRAERDAVLAAGKAAKAANDQARFKELERQIKDASIAPTCRCSAPPPPTKRSPR